MTVVLFDGSCKGVSGGKSLFHSGLLSLVDIKAFSELIGWWWNTVERISSCKLCSSVKFEIDDSSFQFFMIKLSNCPDILDPAVIAPVPPLLTA